MRPSAKTANSKPRSWWPVGWYRVAGESMAPTFRPGQLVVGWRWVRPKIGQVVVLRAEQLVMLKRITQMSGGQYWVEGDNRPLSSDSRQFGAVPRSAIEAVVIAPLRRNIADAKSR